jgi:DNA-binding NarL/FixJ family response regulator
VLPGGDGAEAPRDNDQRIRVLIVDDHDLFREGLRQLIETDDSIEVVGEAATGEEAIERVRDLHPDVVLMDISMPGLDGIRATEHIVRHFPNTHVVMLTMYQNDEYRYHAARAGARGYLVKSIRPEDLFQAIHLAAENGAKAGQSPAATLADQYQAPMLDFEPPPLPPGLPLPSEPEHPPEPEASRPAEPDLPRLTDQERLALLEERLRLLEAQLQQLLMSGATAPAPTAQAETQPAPTPAPSSVPSEPTEVEEPAADEPELRQEVVTWEAPPIWEASEVESSAAARPAGWPLVRVGAVALALGAVALLTLALSQGWIGPLIQLTVGLVASALLLAGSVRLLGRRERLLGHIVLAAGLLTGGLWLLAGVRLYELIPVEAGLVATLILAMTAGALAVLASSEPAAGLALALALGTPALLGLALTPATAAFLAATLIAATVAMLRQGWVWLPWLAFVLLAPQLGRWVAQGISLWLGLLALAGFWALNALMAVAKEFRVPPRRPAPWPALLLLASTAFLIWAGLSLLEDTAARYQGLFLLAIALPNGLLGGYALHAWGDRHPLGLAGMGAGLAALALIFPVRLDGPLVAIGWATLALALAWVYDERRHGYAGVAALALGALALGHLVVVAYPPQELMAGLERDTPFTGPESGAFAALLGALAVAGYFVRSLPVRSCLATAGLLLAIYVLPFETSGLALTAGWALVFVLAVALERRTKLGAAGWQGRLGLPPFASPLYLPILAAGSLALLHALSSPLSPERLGLFLFPADPPTGEPALAAGILIAAALAAGRLSGSVRVRQLAITAAILITAYLLPSELPDAPLVLSWAALAVALFCVLRRCS